MKYAFPHEEMGGMVTHFLFYFFQYVIFNIFGKEK